MGINKKRFWEIMSSHPNPEVSDEEAVRQKLEPQLRKSLANKSDEWLANKRAEMNRAWKKVKHETRSMFCAKDKHDRCTFDPDCSCSCHVK